MLLCVWVVSVDGAAGGARWGFLGFVLFWGFGGVWVSFIGFVSLWSAGSELLAVQVDVEKGIWELATRARFHSGRGVEAVDGIVVCREILWGIWVVSFSISG